MYSYHAFIELHHTIRPEIYGQAKDTHVVSVQNSMHKSNSLHVQVASQTNVFAPAHK
jgi:hypothetical protein